VLRGRPLTLNCSARITDLDVTPSTNPSAARAPSLEPPLAPVSWLRDGEPVPGSEVGEGGALTVGRVTRRTEGAYQCLATHPVAGTLLSTPVHVRYAGTPTLPEPSIPLQVHQAHWSFSCPENRVNTSSRSIFKPRKKGLKLFPGSFSSPRIKLFPGPYSLKIVTYYRVKELLNAPACLSMCNKQYDLGLIPP
jgi:hypothetical protein